MYAGDEAYDDDVTSGHQDEAGNQTYPGHREATCSCRIGRDDDQWERHDEGCQYRRAMDAIMRNGYPA